MALGRPTQNLALTVEEREKLNLLVRRPKTAQAMALRAKIVLGCAQGLTNGETAKQCAVSRVTVGKWRERFRLFRLEGLLDEQRPGAPRSITVRRQLLFPINDNYFSLPATITL